MNIAESISGGPPGFSPANGVNENGTHTLDLALKIVDPDIVTELRRIPEGAERERFALAALRVGVLALRTASGQVDAAAIREAGNALVSGIRDTLSAHANSVSADLRGALQNYFDPKSGMVPQRIQALVAKDGELERILRAHLAPDDSMLARTLAERVGEQSPLLKKLSATEKGGIMNILEETLRTALSEQREAIVSEFSLDREESALSRMVAQIGGKNTELVGDLKQRVDVAVGEFSLDRPDSGLSRLVKSVEKAQERITAEFSTDNEQSAINRLSGLLDETSRKIDANLTLDDSNSALCRVKSELMAAVEALTGKNDKFHTEMRQAIAALQAARKEMDRSTLHGGAFEDQLGELLAAYSQRQNDVCIPTGTRVGRIANCKKGDFVVELGSESQAPGAKIAWEAKESESYSLKDALDELEIARKNREAQLGVFVFSRKSAPSSLDPFLRQGHHIVVVWDAEDRATDIYVKAAYSVARALTIQIADKSEQAGETAAEIDRATRAIEKQLKYLDEFKRYGDNMVRDGGKLADRAVRMKEEIVREIAVLDRQATALGTKVESD